MESWGLLTDILLLLAAALVAGSLLSRLGQSPLLGYIVAGMVLGGPGSAGLVGSEDDISLIAEIGVSLLLFSLGLEFSWARLRSFGARALVGGLVQVVATAALGALVASAFGLGPVPAVAVGAMVSLSSTAAVLRVLLDLGEADSLHGRNSVAILLSQDIAVVPLAVLVTLLGTGGTGSDMLLAVGRVALYAAGLVAVLHVLLDRVAVRVLRSAASERNRELTVLLAVVVGLGATWAAHAVGLSPALGAFVAGMFLGGSPFATQVRADVSSLRIVLLTLFFAAVGMIADPIWIARNALLVLGVTALVLAGKTLVVVGALRALGRPLGVGIATGLCVAQIGEFAFVLGGLAVDRRILSRDVHMLLVSSTIASLFATPYLVAVAPRFAAWVERATRSGAAAAGAGHGAHPKPDVLIVGFGPAGQAVGRYLAGRSVPTVVLDVNPGARTLAESLGLRGEVGDALQPDVLEHVGAASARWIVITLPARTAALEVLAQVRAVNSGAHIVVRTRYQRHMEEFEAAGAHCVVDDEVEVGRSLEARMRALVEAGAGDTVPASDDPAAAHG